MRSIKFLSNLSAFLAALGAMVCSQRVGAQPNLTPFTPPGWSAPVVVADNSVNDTNSASSSFLTTDTLYVSWSVINNGSDESTTFNVDLYVDGALSQTWPIGGGLPSEEYEYVTAYPIGTLAVGTHQVSIIADAEHAVTGDDETDNAYTNTFTVGAVTLAAPTPETPANGRTGLFYVPMFVWSTVTNATSYRALISTDAASLPSDPTATNGGAGVVFNAVAPTNSFSPTIALSPNTTYYWEVHARAATDDGTWSAIQQFTTQLTNTGLTIIPTFDSSITSDPNAATIEATINAAIAVYRDNFTDNVTVHFAYTEMSGGLGENEGYDDNVSYSSYRSALVSRATTPDDTAALASIPDQSSNPVNGNADVDLRFPLARALGYSANPPSGQPDGTVYLNTSIMNLTSAVTDPGKYSLFSTVSHEMDEALGFGSALNGLNNGDAAPTGPILPEDLFRYDGSGNRSLTTDLNATAFFSFDGTNLLAQFNQFDGGDFGDWYSYNAQVVPQVQDAFLINGANPILGVELRILDAIGYSRAIARATSLPAPAQLENVLVNNGNFEFAVFGTVGSSYYVQVSTNLTTWAPLSSNTVPAGGVFYVTNAIGGQLQQFFRVTSPPTPLPPAIVQQAVPLGGSRRN